MSRPRLLEVLDTSADDRLIVLRAPGGSGKSTLLADWISRLADDQRSIVWVALDESTHSRAAFWHRIVQALLSQGAFPTDGTLTDYLRGYVELAEVPGLMLAELAESRSRLTLVLDDFHLIDEASVNDVIWLLERSAHLQVLVTTRQRGRLEEPAIVVALDPTVITGSGLAFNLDETIRMLDRSGSTFDNEDAKALREATGGHPLATRIAIVALASNAKETHPEPIDRDSMIGEIATQAAQKLLPEFSEPLHRSVGLRISLAPWVGSKLAIELTGQQDVDQILQQFERDGLGELQHRDGDSVFAFHGLVGHALQREAERTMDANELADLRRMAARNLEQRGDAMNSLRLYAQLKEYREMWPVVAKNFSHLIVHHQSELEEIIMRVPEDKVRENGTLAIVLAIVLSEQEGAPPARVQQLVKNAHWVLHATPVGTDPLEQFWVLLAIFAGFRAARRYDQAALAGDALLAYLDKMPHDIRATAGSAVGAGLIQVVITYVLVGRLDDAVDLANYLSRDSHTGRMPHRLSLLAYLHAVRGDMAAAESFAGEVTQAKSSHWRATIAATGWHVAKAIIRLERNDPHAALEMISQLDSRLSVLEHWPYLLWVKGTARLASGDPELGLDELRAAIATNRARPASAVSLDLLASLHSDLQLAVGQPGRARDALDQRSPGSRQVTLARARILLAEGKIAEVKASVEPLRWGDPSTLRQQAEALLLHAVADLRLGYPAEAELSVRRAFALLKRHGLRLPLIMVPHTELRELIESQLPEYLPLLDGLADPFSSITAPNPLTQREQEVLTAVASSATLEAVAVRLFVSVNTIKTQLRSIYRKLGVSSREDAVRVAKYRGMLSA